MSSDPEKAEVDPASLASKLLQDPGVMAALQNKMGSLVGTSSSYIETLPLSVKRRIKALKKLQLETTKLEGKFFEEVHNLEMKYLELYKPQYESRAKIVHGSYEPNDDECDWPSDEDEDEEEEGGEAKKEKKAEVDEGKEISGIPEFWLTIFKNVDDISEMIQEHDEPILTKLTDVKISYGENDMSFTLHFFFDPNDYFTNKVLTKTYYMINEIDKDDPFSYDGPDFHKSQGCKIDWKEGKNVTVKTIKKKQKHKSKGEVRSKVIVTQNDSFFNFFSPAEMSESRDEQDEDAQALSIADFEIANLIRESLIPKAVLFFTGEALEGLDDDDGDEEEEDGEEGEEEEDEENDADFDPSKAPKPECKQQ